MVCILIIDDEDPIRDILRQVLERAGYEVAEAQNGREGLQYYRLTPTDLVIIDIEMPEKDGLETIRELQRDFPEIKIIAMSGSGEGWTFLNIAKRLGVQHTFQKPFRLQEMLAAVQELAQIQE